MKPKIELIDPEMIETNYNKMDWTAVFSLSVIAAIVAMFFCHFLFMV